MKSNVLIIISLLLPMAGAISCRSTSGNAPEVQNVIFDTDMAPDYDDVGALAVLHALADSGEARIWLSRSHPGSLKAVHCLPAVFVLVVLFSLAGSFFSLYCAVPLAVYSFLLFIDATSRNKGDLWVGFLSTLASFTQLLGYGTGFWRALTSPRVRRDERPCKPA